ncbi:MAG: hydrolase, HAD-superfamily, subfamily [Daejeonella sp.]|nr:hydrolase, HAD-superfamily, subfamily [Daejeonella sp.]
MNKAIFINKDGTLIKDVPNNVNPKFVSLNEGAIEGLKLLQAKGFYLILITNQEGIAYGHIKEQALLGAVYRVEELLKFKGVYLDGFMLCPHHPNGKIRKYSVDCDCRTPKPGLLLNAAKKYNVDLKSSWIMGNRLDDIEAGNLAGCQTILIQKEEATSVDTESAGVRKPSGVFVDIQKAAEFIITHSQ